MRVRSQGKGEAEGPENDASVEFATSGGGALEAGGGRTNDASARKSVSEPLLPSRRKGELDLLVGRVSEHGSGRDDDAVAVGHRRRVL